METRIAPAFLGLRQALKISIYDYLPKFHQINVELFLKCYNVIIYRGKPVNLTLARARSIVDAPSSSLYLNVNNHAQYLSKDLRNRK